MAAAGSGLHADSPAGVLVDGTVVVVVVVVVVGVGVLVAVLVGVVTTGTVACDLAVTGGGFDVRPLAGLMVVVGGSVVVVDGTVVVVTTGTVDAGVGAGGGGLDTERFGWVVGTDVVVVGMVDAGIAAFKGEETPTTVPLADPSAGPAVASRAITVASNPATERTVVPAIAVARLKRRLGGWLHRKYCAC